jgi:hypothetical protein
MPGNCESGRSDGPNLSRLDGRTLPTSAFAAELVTSSPLLAEVYAEGPATAGVESPSATGAPTLTSGRATTSPQLQHAPAIAGSSVPHREHFTRFAPSQRRTSKGEEHVPDRASDSRMPAHQLPHLRSPWCGADTSRAHGWLADAVCR